MKLYNGSKDNGNIKEFRTDYTTHGYVYATSSRLVALTYIANVFPYYFYSGADGKEYYIEIIPNLFEITTKNREGWLYELEEATDLEPVEQKRDKCAHKHCYRTNHNLKVTNVEYIKDVNAELQKYINSGELKVITYDESDKERVKRLATEIITIYKKGKTPTKDNYAEYIVDFYKDIIE